MDPERDAMVKAAAERIRRRHRELSERAAARRARAQEFARELVCRLAQADDRVEKIVGFGSTFETWRTYRLDSEDEFLYAALGYTIHNLYNAIESHFYRFAKFFGNELGEADWHKTLVDRMTLDIEGVRPALIDLQAAQIVDELRRFRHLFRNLFKQELDRP